MVDVSELLRDVCAAQALDTEATTKRLDQLVTARLDDVPGDASSSRCFERAHALNNRARCPDVHDLAP